MTLTCMLGSVGDSRYECDPPGQTWSGYKAGEIVNRLIEDEDVTSTSEAASNMTRCGFAVPPADQALGVGGETVQLFAAASERTRRGDK